MNKVFKAYGGTVIQTIPHIESSMLNFKVKLELSTCTHLEKGSLTSSNFYESKVAEIYHFFMSHKSTNLSYVDNIRL